VLWSNVFLAVKGFLRDLEIGELIVAILFVEMRLGLEGAKTLCTPSPLTSIPFFKNFKNNFQIKNKF